MQLKQAAIFSFADTGGNSADALPGWDLPEHGIRWPQGRSSRLSLPLLPVPGDAVLLLEVVPALALPLLTQQTLRIRVNGVTQRLVFLTRPTALSIPVPAALAAMRPALELDFDHPDVIRPHLISISRETRGRSVGFRSLAVLEAQLRPTLPPAQADAPLLPQPEMLSDEALAAYFLSLGDNCEFGLAQRLAGAEPMDLLRFTGIELPGLARGLAEGFAQVCNPGAVDLELYPFTPRSEYVVASRTYNFHAHTGQFEGDMEVPRLYIREMKKLVLMQRLLAADLASGHRILIFKNNDITEQSDISPILRGISAHGPAVLLHVVCDKTGNRVGQVEQVGPAYLRGYIDRFNAYDNAEMPASPAWSEICRNAYALWRAARLSKDVEAASRAGVA